MSAMLRIDGGVVFWTLGQNSDKDAIAKGWYDVDPKWEKVAPQDRSRESCLHDALVKIFPRALLRPLDKRSGFAVLHEIRSHDEVQTVTTHAVGFDDLGQVEMRRGYEQAMQDRIALEYRYQRGLVKPMQVAKSLTTVASLLGAVTLRPTGGVYWMPDSSLSTWNRLAGVVQASAVDGHNYIYRITHAFDSESIVAVRDALLNEADAHAARIIAEVESNELGERALINRANEADALMAKVEEYERILSQALPTARSIAERAGLAATAAKILAPTAA